MEKIVNDVPIGGVLKWIREERNNLRKKLDQIVPYAKGLEKKVEALEKEKQILQEQFSALQKQQGKELRKNPEFKAMQEKYVRVKKYNTQLNNLVGKLHRELEKKEEILKDKVWISCEDSLPSESGWYFTCVEMCGQPQCVGVTYFNAKQGQWVDFEAENVKGVVDDWMAIPRIFK